MSRSDVIQQAGERGDLLPETVNNLETWITGDFLPDWAAVSIGELIENEEWTELNNRFFRDLQFGTGGMRGRTIGEVVTPSERGQATVGDCPEHAAVGTNSMNDFNVVRATLGLYRYTAQWLTSAGGHFDRPRLVIAHDVRNFSRYFAELAASAWVKAGGQAFIFDGPRPTPQLSFSVRLLRAHAGVMITASHNPPHDNGFKAYFTDGGQVVSPHAEGIVAAVRAVDFAELPDYLEVDLSRTTVLSPEADEAYAEALRENILDEDTLRQERLRVVFTPIHGTGGIHAVPALEAAGVEVIHVEEQDRQDPWFPSVKSPNPENAEALAMGIAKAEETGAEAVLATDPDGDRMGLAARDGEGKLVLLTGNQIGALLAEYRIRSLKEGGIIPEEGSERAAIITTFVTTPLQLAIAKVHGLKCIETLTGFKFIAEKMDQWERELREGLMEEEGIALDYDRTSQWTRAELALEYGTYFVFGSEESYGYLASDRVRDKDGNAAVLMLCELLAVLRSEGQTLPGFLDEMYLEYGYFLERTVNLYYEGASGAQRISAILESYRESPPDILAGEAVSKFIDFGREEIFDADGVKIPPQDLYLLELESGYRYAVRGSGTEPKIKFYLFGREEAESAESLPGVKEKTALRLEVLAQAVEADARKRAGE